MTEIILFITESEYMALSLLMRDVIQLMELLKELNEVVHPMIQLPQYAAPYLKTTRVALI